jgi:hypothetical protein
MNSMIISACSAHHRFDWHSTHTAHCTPFLVIDIAALCCSLLLSASLQGDNRLSLYKVMNQNGYKIIRVTESTSTTVFMHTGQCSNRGNCNLVTGLCKCFMGYMGDNCNTVNKLAM